MARREGGGDRERPTIRDERKSILSSVDASDSFINESAAREILGRKHSQTDISARHYRLESSDTTRCHDVNGARGTGDQQFHQDAKSFRSALRLTFLEKGQQRSWNSSTTMVGVTEDSSIRRTPRGREGMGGGMGVD